MSIDLICPPTPTTTSTGTSTTTTTGVTTGLPPIVAFCPAPYGTLHETKRVYIYTLLQLYKPLMLTRMVSKVVRPLILNLALFLLVCHKTAIGGRAINIPL